MFELRNICCVPRVKNNEWRAAQRVKYIKCAAVIKMILQEPVLSSVRLVSFSLKESVRAWSSQITVARRCTARLQVCLPLLFLDRTLLQLALSRWTCQLRVKEVSPVVWRDPAKVGVKCSPLSVEKKKKTQRKKWDGHLCKKRNERGCKSLIQSPCFLFSSELPLNWLPCFSVVSLKSPHHLWQEARIFSFFFFLFSFRQDWLPTTRRRAQGLCAIFC